MAASQEPALDQVARRAAQLRDSLLGDRKDACLPALRILEATLDASFRSASYFQISAAAHQAWNTSVNGLNPGQKAAWGACLLSDLISQVPQRLPNFPTPKSILPHTAFELSRILDELQKPSAAPQDLQNDLFLKDLVLCRLDGFPCVAQIVDKNASIPRRLVGQTLFQEPAALLKMGLSTGFRYAPTFEIHTHTPMLKGFNPEGWDQCYLLVADLLELYPHYHGLTGGSWFYDPELDRVSPRLAYLRKRPLSGGAFLIPMGQRKEDIINATATSESRRKLYEVGEYKPTAWMMIWPRQALIDWARANRSTK